MLIAPFRSNSRWPCNSYDETAAAAVTSRDLVAPVIRPWDGPRLPSPAQLVYFATAWLQVGFRLPCTRVNSLSETGDGRRPRRLAYQVVPVGHATCTSIGRRRTSHTCPAIRVIESPDQINSSQLVEPDVVRADQAAQQPGPDRTVVAQRRRRQSVGLRRMGRHPDHQWVVRLDHQQPPRASSRSCTSQDHNVSAQMSDRRLAGYERTVASQGIG